MMPKALLLILWFPFVGILLFNNLVLLDAFSAKNKPLAKDNAGTAQKTLAISAAAPSQATGQVLAANIIAGDGRTLLLEEFMRGTPLGSYASHFIWAADQYGLDYRLVPAIAMCESNLGVRIPSADSHNAWGIAVYTGQQEGAEFVNWPSAIDWVTRFISEKFVAKGIVDIKEIGAVWAPPSVEKGHSWANCVEGFMRSIQ
jgi:hypothetical protein